MTSLTDNRIDELIRRVKNHGAAADFVFIPGYPPHKTPNPVTQYTVAVVNKETKVSAFFVGNRVGRSAEGRLYDIELRLRVYAPENSSGSALLRASAVLSDALEAEDHDRLIDRLSLSGIGFDTASRTEFRDVIAGLRIITDKEAAV